ncbi:anhydro-N-acetylmuramic acid kinase [Egicoccus halophilus]|uniref:Anhydro-N-acetylmuramic acid kinase n=1 Tax=Egicoccus halophilus TaxID=1670830 RepID=A0A8J3ACA3_9ACTN|nr:anhydro-N-acetylmuramic acid kinase [Egicoccus halophilus]GGI08418.1 anhydro-N-acetylmuramic acid kinase [Egicoccus halophilus]
MRVVGMMSGTSVDGVDVAVVDVDAVDGGERLVLRRVAEATVPFDPALRQRVLDVLPGSTAAHRPDVGELCRLDADLGRALAAAARQAVTELADGAADLLVSHGQSVHHEVVDGRVLATLQLGQPAEIAEATGLPVVSDLRTRDVAAGGQGAPLVSLLDQLVLADTTAPVAALNLGGIANLTVVAPDRPTVAFDAGPANALLDAAVRTATDGREHHDPGGRRTAVGRVDEALLAVLLDDPFLAAPAPKSTGKERYHAGYLDRALAAAPVDRLEDRLATLAEAVAVAVADHAARHAVRRVVGSGGGVHNAGLVAALRRRLAAMGATWDTSDTLGLPVDGKEAIAFALLGWLSWHGLPGTVASCTGAAGPRVLGSLTPGADPLRLPASPAAAPRSATVLGPVASPK